LTSIIIADMSSLEATSTPRHTSPQRHKTSTQDDDNSVIASVINDDEDETQQQTTNYLGIRCCVQGCIFKRSATTEEVLLCESPHCDKSLHLSCYKQRIVKDNKKHNSLLYRTVWSSVPKDV
jgi:hypothetical protein